MMMRLPEHSWIVAGLAVFAPGPLNSQTLISEWEFETLNQAIYVGDIDGDGVGEFADNSFQNEVTFFDAGSRAVKYTVPNTGMNITIEETSIDFKTYNNGFPSIDYDNNGVNDFIFVDLFNPVDPVYRIIDPSTGIIIFEFPQNGLYQFGWLGDFDNDGILELSLSYYQGTGSTQNVIYSTGVAVTSVRDGDRYLPSRFHLSQNYPNPFNPSTAIEFSVPKAGRVHLNIYNSAGQLVRTLLDQHSYPGSYSVSWDGRGMDDTPVPSGAYFYQIHAGDFVSTKKMVLVK